MMLITFSVIVGITTIRLHSIVWLMKLHERWVRFSDTLHEMINTTGHLINGYREVSAYLLNTHTLLLQGPTL